MRLLILARDAGPAAVIKERFDRRGFGLTLTVPLVDPDAAERAVFELKPSWVVIASKRLDRIVLEMCDLLGARMAPSEASFVAATEAASEPERVAALNAGADRVIQPVDAVAIERWVHARPQRACVRGAIHVHDVSIESDGSTVIVSGQRVTLRPREWALLRHLVCKRDGVVSRNELEQNLWGTTRSRTLDVHIARLRAKLGSVGNRIQTVVKVGYRYVDGQDGEPRQTLRRQETPPQPSTDTPVVITSLQGKDVIRRRREIREAFHDDQALTIKGPRF